LEAAEGPFEGPHKEILGIYTKLCQGVQQHLSVETVVGVVGAIIFIISCIPAGQNSAFNH
jgi:hypothetical protein